MINTCQDIIGVELCDLFEALGYRIDAPVADPTRLWAIHAWREPGSFFIGHDEVLYRWYPDGDHVPLGLDATSGLLRSMLDQAQQLGVDAQLAALAMSMRAGRGGAKHYSFGECLRIAQLEDVPLSARYDMMEFGVDVDVMLAHFAGRIPMGLIYDMYAVDFMD